MTITNERLSELEALLDRPKGDLVGKDCNDLLTIISSYRAQREADAQIERLISGEDISEPGSWNDGTLRAYRAAQPTPRDGGETTAIVTRDERTPQQQIDDTVAAQADAICALATPQWLPTLEQIVEAIHPGCLGRARDVALEAARRVYALQPSAWLPIPLTGDTSKAPFDGGFWVVNDTGPYGWQMARWASDRLRGERVQGWWDQGGFWLDPQPTHLYPIPDFNNGARQ